MATSVRRLPHLALVPLLAGTTVAAAAAVPPTAADDASGPAASGPAPTEHAPEPWWIRDRLAGDWGGVRSDLEDAGVTVDATFLGEWTAVVDGGVDEDDSFRRLITVDLALDLGVLAGLEGGTFFARYLSINPERGGSRDAGDIQVASNIESAAHLDTVYEAWFEQRLLGDRVRLKIGKLDANAEFAFVDAAGEFASSSAGVSPTIVGKPTYPDSAFSVNAFARVLETDRTSLTLGYGLYDGAAGADGIPTGRRGPSTFLDDDRSDDWFHVAQADLAWDRLGAEGGRWWREGRIGVGVWHHTGTFDRFDGGTEDGTTGFYLVAEQRVTAAAAPAAGRPDDGRGLFAFAQYGWADDAVSELGQHVGGGLVLRGTFAGRDEDSAGVYVSWVDLSDEPGAGFAGDETAIDASYRIRLTPAIHVQPELQLILDPSGDPAIPDATVLGLRVEVAF